MERLEHGLRAEIQAAAESSRQRDTELGERIDRVEHGLRAEIQASAAETPRLIAESEDRIHRLIAESEERTRRHFDVVAEALHGDVRSLAEGIMAVAEGSLRRDAEQGERTDRLDQRVLGLEARVSILEQPPPRRRRRR
jgi:hypothetical protein